MFKGDPNYCYWSLATGEQEGQLMSRCVQSAREVGIFRSFHVLTDRIIDDCECYDAMQVERKDGMEKMICLKAAMSRLSFDYFVWLEPRTRFRREPGDLCSLLRRSPLHVPLSAVWPKLDRKGEDSEDERAQLEFMGGAGILGRPYFGYSRFWIVHRDAIDLVTETTVEFWKSAKDQGLHVGVDLALAFAMQLFCGDRREHCWERRPEYWCPEEKEWGVPNPESASAAIVG